MADCIIRSGESVDPRDSRLSDTACMIESGVIIRPAPDLAVAVAAEPPPPPPLQMQAPPVQAPPHITKPVVPPTPPAPVIVEEPPPIPAVVKTSETVAHTVVPSEPVVVKVEEPSAINPTTVMIAAGAAVAVAGTATVGFASGGLSAFQAKAAALLGTSKGTIAAATVVTAGTIVAVKALESKMGKLEKDMKRAKDDVNGAASSIDRIDALLDKLGS